MKKTEIILAILAVIAVMLNYLLVPGGVMLTVLTLSSLSCLYFAFSFALLNDIRFRNIFKSDSYKNIGALKIVGAIGTGWALSMAMNGLLFKLLYWPGAAVSIVGGMVSLSIPFIICVVKYVLGSNRAYYSRVLIRTGIVITCCVFIMPFSSEQLHQFKYRNYPSFLEAEKQYHENPDNQELLNKYEEERQKMDEQQ
ncbi:MAG: hypothetical protein V4580_14910 [Bacteroidota bacterium]